MEKQAMRFLNLLGNKFFGTVKQNLKVVEVPVTYRARTYGSTNISRFRHGWLLLKMSWVAFKKIKWLGKAR